MVAYYYRNLTHKRLSANEFGTDGNTTKNKPYADKVEGFYPNEHEGIIL